MQLQSTPFGISKKTGVPKSTIQEVKKRFSIQEKDIKEAEIPWKIPTPIQRGSKTGTKKILLREKFQRNQKCIMMDDQTVNSIVQRSQASNFIQSGKGEGLMFC